MATKRTPKANLRTPASGGKKAPRAALKRPRAPLPFSGMIPDPLRVDDYPEGIEAASTEEAKQLREALTEARERERERFDKVYNVGYFFCVVFETGAQAEAFLAYFGAGLDEAFVDGRVLADRLSIELPKGGDIPYNIGGGTARKGSRKPPRLGKEANHA